MPLQPRQTVGPYEIIAKIGEGGMGEVFRARDVRLGREVAIKVLPSLVGGDTDRLARFDREARLLAALNHPNIATVYGIESWSDGADVAHPAQAIAMELVEGDTLADRLRRGPLQLADALPIATQIADALDAAHQKGIVHRDLKPANVKVTPARQVKVLDFGLAKAVAPASAAEAEQRSTATIDATQLGTIVGTAAYMSPEQVRGEPVDKRTDIWAFGCLLFELLTGRAPFARPTAAESFAAVLEHDPPWTDLPAGTPQGVRRLLRRSLEKDPVRRMRDIGDARAELDEVNADAKMSGAAAAAPARTSRRAILVSVLALLVAVAAAAAWWWTRRPPPPMAGEVHLEITTPTSRDLVSMEISPDGRRVAFAADDVGGSGIWVRDLNVDGARLIPMTAGGRLPFWSPDGRTLGFFADGRLKRVDVDRSAAPLVLADAPNPQGGSWTTDGNILFAPTQISPVLRVRASGGTPVPVTRLAAGEIGHVFPQALADGVHFLYAANGSADVDGEYLASFDGAVRRRLLAAVGRAVMTSTGHLLFARDNALFAQRLDVGRQEMVGEPVRVSDSVATENSTGPTGLAVSAAAAGPIVYRSPRAAGRQLVWFDRGGRELSRVGGVSEASQVPALSPDGRTLALRRIDGGNRDIWLFDLTRGALTRVTFDGANDGDPLFTPDGAGLVFDSLRSGALGIYRKAIGGSTETPVYVTSANTAPAQVSPDGRLLLFLRADPKTLLDIWALSLEGDGDPYPIVQSAREDLNPQISPDGRWLAYQSNESGRYEVSVRPFPGPGRTVQVSTAGGTQPRWAPDGRELFYLDLDRRLIAVPIAPSRDGQSVEVGNQKPLFATQVGGDSIVQREYLVSPDGQRFLFDTPVSDASPPISVILNWQPPN